MKKRVGVVLRPNTLKSGKSVYTVLESIQKIIIENECIPISITPNVIDINKKLNDSEKEELINEIKNLDGVILQGGDNFYDYDRVIAKYFIENNIPTLGICLGMQLLASLYEDNLILIDKSKYNEHKLEDGSTHKIKIDKNSKLYKILNVEETNVNTYHKEMITNPGIFSVSAVSSDNIIEAIEYNKNDFAIGVQWHPEKDIDTNIESKKIFEEFFKTIKSYKRL